MRRYVAEILTGDGCQKLWVVFFDTLKEAIEYYKDILPEGYTLVSVEHESAGFGFGESSGTLNYKKGK